MQGDLQHSGSGQAIQVILLVHRKVANLVKQTYPNLMVINSDYGTAPQFFQAELNKNVIPAVYGFLSEHDYLTNEYSIETILRWIENPYIGCVYTDSLLEAHSKVPQVYPPFSRNVLSYSLINTPLFVGSKILKGWDTKLETTYFFDYFKNIGSSTLLAHVPHPVITSKYSRVSPEEIAAIKKKYE